MAPIVIKISQAVIKAPLVLGKKAGASTIFKSIKAAFIKR